MALLILALFLSLGAHAAPVLDSAEGFDEVLNATVVSDSVDPNQYYFFPSHYGLAEEGEKLLFSYNEKEKFLGTYGYVSSIFVATLSEQTKRAIVNLRSQKPNARFAAIPMVQTSVQALEQMNPLLSRVDCQDYGGVAGQRVGCVWVVKPRQTQPFLEIVRREGLIQVLYFNYSFMAQVGGKLTEIQHSVPVYFSGLGEGAYFFDAKGRPIP